MTDATVEQQGESKRRTEHPEVPQTATAAMKAQPTMKWDWWICVRFSVKIPRGPRKPVAVAEGREGGPATLDLTKWDFNKADCRTRCRKLIENSKPLLLMGSPIDSDGEDEQQTRNTSARGRYFLRAQSHSAKSWDQPPVVDFMNRFPDTFQTVTDRSLFGLNVHHGMNMLTR